MAADYGTDFSCSSSLDPRMTLVTGEELMRQICVRRLSTPLGTLLSNPDAVTLDTREFLSREYDGSAAALLKANCTSALVDDVRILSATVSPVFDSASRTISIQIQGQGTDGPFSLTVAVSRLTVEALAQ